MKKIYLTLIALISISWSASGQQDPIYAQYVNNPMVINPAYTGINNVLNASLSYRNQWAGFENSPTTTSFAAHSSFFDNKIGGGLVIISDKLGSIANTQINATYAYKLYLGGATFSFGLQTGILNLRDDNTELNARDADDPLFEGNQSVSKFNFGAGLALKGDDFFIGLSIPRLTNTTADFGNLTSSIYQRHFYLSGGYVHEFNSSFALKSTTLIKGVSGSPWSVDLNSSLIIKDRIYAGLLTRNFQTYGLLAQFNINENFRAGYVIEVPTNQSVGANFTSHELTLTVDFEIFDFHFQKERYF